MNKLGNIKGKYWRYGAAVAVGVMVGVMGTLVASGIRKAMTNEKVMYYMARYNIICTEYFNTNGSSPESTNDLIRYFESRNKGNSEFMTSLKDGSIRYYRLSNNLWAFVSYAPDKRTRTIIRIRSSGGYKSLVVGSQGRDFTPRRYSRDTPNPTKEE